MREVDIKLKEKDLEDEKRRLKEAQELLEKSRKKEEEMKVRTKDLIVQWTNNVAKAHLERTEKELKAKEHDMHDQKKALEEQQRLLSSSWQTHQVIWFAFWKDATFCSFQVEKKTLEHQKSDLSLALSALESEKCTLKEQQFELQTANAQIQSRETELESKRINVQKLARRKEEELKQNEKAFKVKEMSLMNSIEEEKVDSCMPFEFCCQRIAIVFRKRWRGRDSKLNWNTGRSNCNKIT